MDSKRKRQITYCACLFVFHDLSIKLASTTCCFHSYDDQGIVQLSSDCLRPRARTTLNFDDISVGDVVMANYNCDEPNERGFWYDVEVTHLVRTLLELSKIHSRGFKLLNVLILCQGFG